MNLIKGFFSKLFVAKHQNDAVVQKQEQDDSLLKEAARNAVVNAFQHENSQINSIPPDILKMLEEYNENFFNAFNIPKNHYKLKFDKKSIIVQVNDKDFEATLSKSDKLSNSYEHIFLRLVQKEFKGFDYRLFLHAGNSAQKHLNYIMGIAKKLALRVQKTGHKITISSKSSYERSLIHGVVEKIPGITSKSTGPFHQRRLVIYPVRNSTKNIAQTNE